MVERRGFAKNRAIYNRPEEVKNYSEALDLQPAEHGIVKYLNGCLSRCDMLDVGVGGGRTTEYFIDRVSSYVGIDYADEMVKVCRSKYQKGEFMLANAASLIGFGDGTFDFVLFSFNGIDCLDKVERQHAMDESFRVLRKGGHFAFSSHNPGYLPALRDKYKILVTRSAGVTYRSIARFFSFWFHNRYGFNFLRNGMIPVYEGDFGFSGTLMYVDPDLQADLIARSGFELVEAFECDTEEPAVRSSLRSSRCPWIYYLCRKP